MIDMIVSGTILICAILVLRRLTYRKISMRMRYTLWLVVAVRMILPVSLGSSSFSIMNMVQGISQRYVEMAGAEEIYKNGVDESDGNVKLVAGTTAEAGDGINAAQGALTGADRPVAEVDGNGMKTDMSGAGVDGAEAGADLAASSADRNDVQRRYGVQERFPIDLRLIAVMIWAMGVIAVGGLALFRQVRFIVYLRRTGEKAPTDCLPAVWAERLSDHGMQVWLVEGLPGPCMAGKSIYISPELYEKGETRLHILAHEYAHAVQGDTLWAAVRGILCTVWWFHPLVWLAAYEAKQDSELACDERAVRLLGETQRFSYGRTLLDLMNAEHTRIGANGVVLTMDGSSRRIRQRISMLADAGKRSKAATGIVALSVLLLCGCAYTGAKTIQETNSERQVGEAGTPIDADEEALQAQAAEQAEAAQIQSRWEELEEEERRAGELEREREAAANAMDAAEEEQIWQRFEEQIRQQSEELKAQEAALSAEWAALEAAQASVDEEQAEVEKKWEQRDQEQIQLQQMIEELEERKASLKAEQVSVEKQQALVQREMERIKAEWTQATAKEFEGMLGTSDDVLADAEAVDIAAYNDYLYHGGQFPLEDDTWYLLHRDVEYGIDFYGLYTDQYGCRGVKMMIDGDVNGLDLPWLPTTLEPEVFMLEQTEDGLPRTFAFQMCQKNTGSSEIWKLYLVDRYDTGSIDLYAFDEEDYQKQFRDKVSFTIDQQNEKVLLLKDGVVMKGGIDISEYGNYTVEDVFWDGSTVGYSMEDDGDSLNFVTSIGLKLAETNEIQYSRLSLITCPVQIGEWGNRSFTLGSPTVDLRHVNSMVQSLELKF